MKKIFLIGFFALFFISSCSSYQVTWLPKYDYSEKQQPRVYYDEINRYNDPMPMSKWALIDILRWGQKEKR